MPAAPVLIKKYGNRRLYDTGNSRYITLEELSAKIQAGSDVRVIDVKSGEDLTQVTLTQIIIEGRGAGKLLPISLLTQLIRLGDDALAEFFGRYVTGALDLYLHAKRGASAVTTYNPFAQLPFAASDAMARMWMNSPFAGGSGPSPQHQPMPPMMSMEPADDERADDVADLRRELEELKRSMGSADKKPSKPRRRPPKKAKKRGG
jgi:polyhydroxyalkanoate synthesis repressor PhaR